jgi:hypothetical protein
VENAERGTAQATATRCCSRFADERRGQHPKSQIDRLATAAGEKSVEGIADVASGTEPEEAGPQKTSTQVDHTTLVKV